MRLLFVLLLVAFTALRAVNGSLTVTPSTLAASFDIVTATWSGHSAPSALDVIGIYVPADAHDSDPIGWLNVTSSPTWRQGHGSVATPLVNMRQPYSLRYINGDGSRFSAPATVAFASYDEPTGVHLALGDTAGSMVVMWTSRSGPNDSHVVRFGASAQALDRTAAADSVTYRREQMVAAPASDERYFKDPGYLHAATMDALAPGSRYYYQVRSADGPWSQLYSFPTPPAPGAHTEVRIAAYGDLGVTPPFSVAQEVQYPANVNVNLMAAALAQDPDAFHMAYHIGDISYARGYAYLWDYYFSLIEPVSARVPYMVGIGNHEWDYPGQPFRPPWSDYGSDSGGEAGLPYLTRHRMPQPKGASANLWYSYDFGPVHFVVMSTEHDYFPGSPQYEFLSADMAMVDRSVTPWMIFGGHRPFYTSSQQGSGSGTVTHLRETFEPLFLRYGVDVALYGHVHQYERTCMGLHNFTCGVPGAPVHVVIGNAGNDYQVPWDSVEGGCAGHFLQPEWSAFRTDNFGYSFLRASRCHLDFSFIGFHDGLVHDRFELNKC